MAERLGKEVLYPLQEAVMASLLAMNDPQMAQAKLCGGTALSRFWLNHRISHDLDFFLPHGFKALAMSMALKKAGIDYDTRDIVDDPRKANQLHGYVSHQGKSLKVSFVEDAYFDVFPAVEKRLGVSLVRTEEIPGLYHRKLRTVAGGGAEGDSFEGGRQKARDVFDLYVLSVAFKPIREFMASLPYGFPGDAFDNGLANMPWFDLMGELGEIACDGKWERAKDMSFLQESLFAQIGATAMVDELAKEPPPPKPTGPARRRGKTPGDGGRAR